jgi:pyridoxamine 5'-phosphate oxidase
VSAEESDAYFSTRPIESRWSVYASRQSDVIESRDVLESRYNIARQTYGDRVARPAWWGGYRIVPDAFEFWQGRPNRLHDRLRYVKNASGAWQRERLAP